MLAYGTYERVKSMTFSRSGFGVRPTETRSNCFDCRPGIRPLKSRFLICSLTPMLLASAFSRSTSYPAGWLLSRYISGLNWRFMPTTSVPDVMRPSLLLAGVLDDDPPELLPQAVTISAAATATPADILRRTRERVRKFV